MTKTAIFCLCVLMFAGCGIARRMEEDERAKVNNAALAAANASCEARAKANEFKGNLPRVQCYNEALLTWWEARPHNDDIDLVRLRNAQVAALADDLDHGKITITQYNLAWAQIMSGGRSMMEQRFAQRDLAAAARDQAYAAQSMAGPRHCQRVGNGVTCY